MSINPALVPKRKLYTGEEIPCIGMGTFGSDRYTPEQVSKAVADAIRIGYRLFDCASVYGNEDLIGEVFSAAIADGTVKREELFVTSKVWNDMHGRGDVLLSLAKSLKDLQLNTIDAFFVHWPFPNYHAPGCDGDARNPDSVPFSVKHYMSVWRQMERLADMGLARNIGMSNMTISKLKATLPLCRIRPALIEMELHPGFQQPELFDYCVSEGMLPVGFCPIGSPSRPERDKAPGDVADTEIPAVAEIAKAHGVHPAVVCLKWALGRGAVPIPFSVNTDKLESNLRCTIEKPLTDAQMAAIEKADCNCRLVKGQVFLWEGAAGWEDLWD